MSVTLHQLLKTMVERGGSDLHVTTNSALRLRSPVESEIHVVHFALSWPVSSPGYSPGPPVTGDPRLGVWGHAAGFEQNRLPSGPSSVRLPTMDRPASSSYWQPFVFEGPDRQGADVDLSVSLLGCILLKPPAGPSASGPSMHRGRD